MKLQSGNGYVMQFGNGGVAVYRDGKALYVNRRPLYAFIKTALSITEFYDAPYDAIETDGERVIARGCLKSPTGAELAMQDTYEVVGRSFKVSRTTTVLRNVSDYGFASKLSFVLAASEDIMEYDCFAPANWYRQNEYSKPYSMGYDKSCEYYWRNEVNYTLPLFAMQNRASGEMIMLSRWAGDVTMRDNTFVQSEHVVDRKFTIGSIGFSKPRSETLNYLYYGFPLRKEIGTRRQGLYIDYVYPGTDGELPRTDGGYNVDYMMRTKTMTRVYHPMEEGFSHSFSIAVDFGCYDGYYPMMRDAWRIAYARLADPIFPVDHRRHYTLSMEALTNLTRKYGDSWGLPFACQLPQMDVSSVSFQFGFVGQQPGIGYQLIRYGDIYSRPESYRKGMGIVDFWVRTAMTPFGAPQNCYNPTISGFEPIPFWTRLIADGLENILDAYVYLKKRGVEKPDWLDFCVKAGDRFVRIQNDDGSWYRAYNTEDDSMRMDSKANTISVVRFMIQLYLVTGDEAYRRSAMRAGDWAWANTYRLMEYRGSTCDNTDITDNESGIYAIFGFLALYDLTGEQKWLEALTGAADYTETWTYCWSFPVVCPWPNHPFTQNRISGQSPVTLGGGGGDMYMAACAYVYYRLYVITGDSHYRDYAEFIHNNTRQANDLYGEFGYAQPGLSHEGGHFASQVFASHYHWLPWVTYVEVDPVSRLYDTFGAYDIAGADQLDPREREMRNRIYDDYWRQV